VRKWQPWRDDKPKCGGMDTETTHGYVRLITCPNSYIEFGHFEGEKDEDGQFVNPKWMLDKPAEEILQWILDHSEELIFFFNLKYDAGVIVKSLGIDFESKGPARDLWLSDHKVVIGAYSVTMIGSKSFRVERVIGEEKVVRVTKKKSKAENGFKKVERIRKEFTVHKTHRVDCFDAAAFFTKDEHRITLEEAGQTFLGAGKLDVELGIDRARIGNEDGYYEAHRDDIIKYGMMDAEITQRLGEYLVNVTGETLGFWPTRWSSAASLSKAWLGKYHPEISQASKTAYKVFRRSFRGALFVTRILGRVPNQDELDLRQAYTSAILNLPSLEGLEEKHGTARSEDAVYGCYFITIPFDGKLGFRLSDLTGQQEWNPDELPFGEPIFYPDSAKEMKPYWATLEELKYFDEEKIPYTIQTAYELCGVPKGKAFDLPNDLVRSIRPLANKVIELKAKAKQPEGHPLKCQCQHCVEAPRWATMRETFKRVVNATFRFTCGITSRNYALHYLADGSLHHRTMSCQGVA
jgi:hypothetical protein